MRGERVAAGDAEPLHTLAAGLHELELPFRATLELRYRRGLPDETIAAVARFEQDEIQRQRRRALIWLAQRTGTRGPDAIEVIESGLASLTPAAWAGEPEPADELPSEPAAAPEPEPEPEALPGEPRPDLAATQQLPTSAPPPRSPSASAPRPVPQPKPFPTPSRGQSGERSGDSGRRILGILALVAAAVALILILTSGDSDGDSGAVPAPQTTGSQGSGSDGSGSQGSGAKGGAGEGTAAGAVAMEFVPGADATGGIEVSLSGSGPQPKIEIALDGLPEPDGEYRGWLYDSVVDSRTLGRSRSGDGVISAKLPEDWQRYGFIDLSVQEPGSVAHSGRSVARIAIADLPTP